MITRFQDFSVETLTDGKGTIFFACGHSLMGDKVCGNDLSHNCEGER